MGKSYSYKLEEGIRILYFQADESMYQEGVEWIKQAVEEGEADAYYFLARCYAWGEGNTAENMQLARKLSQQGIAAGSNLCVLGADRFHGLTGELAATMKGTLEDAFRGSLRQAEEGNPMAQYAIALFYYWQDISALQQPKNEAEYNKNEKQNAKESLKWNKLAAQQGCIPAFRNHYACLAKGSNGAPHDLKAAMRFVEEVKDQVDIPLHFFSEFAGRYEELGQKKDQIRWLESGKAKGDGDCCNDLGIEYLDGNGVKKDQSKALELFRLAADAGELYGEYNIGRCYYYGYGTAENNEEAFAHFSKAAEGDVAVAQNMLASCYYYGHGTEVNYDKCFLVASSAFKNGNKASSYFLGKCYLYGQGTPQNAAKAKEYLEQNADSGNAGAYFLLGEMYDKALGIPENIDQAISYYQKAIENGSNEAAEALAHFKKSLLGKWKRRINA